MRLVDAEWLLSLYEYIDTTDFKKRANVPLDVVIQNIKDAPTIEPSGDLISRAEAIEAVEYNSYGMGSRASVKAIKALPSAEQTIQTPQTYGKSINPSNAEVVDDLISREDAIEVVCKELQFQEENRNEPYDNGTCFGLKTARELLLALPSADTKRVPQGYCKGANCKWWNPQVNGCNRCVMIQDEYRHTSADRPQVNSAEWVAEKEKEFDELHRPKGEWIENDVLGWKCSKCGIVTNIDSNFCPCCGADMRPEK